MVLYDQWDRPIDTSALKREEGGATVTGVRQPVGGHPASGLTPQRLGRLLREAEAGSPRAYLELAEDMEERDMHYASVLGTRKRQVAGLEITVEAATDDQQGVDDADLVRDFLARDELADELIDVLDAIGKGFSCTEIIWETSERDWRPSRLEYRDPAWFDFAPDRRTPLLIGDGGALQPLTPFKWIQHFAKAKSGLPIRAGLARPVAWGYLFKSLSIKDWAVFLEVYGQPLRVGKYDAGATERDKEILLSAVRNLGTDAAAIIPDSMKIEFVQAATSGSQELYERNADWWDRQVSKMVLGQTGTTDAIAGGYAVGKVHDGVREDIGTADARQLMATLNRDLVRPLVDLNRGPRQAYPRIKIGRPDQVDVDKLVTNVSTLVPFGLRVSEAVMRDKLGLPDPGTDETLLSAPTAAASPPPDLARARASRQPAVQTPAATDAVDTAIDAILADQGWEQLVAPMIDGLEQQLAMARNVDEATAILVAHFRGMDPTRLAEKLAQAAFGARLAGETDEPLS